MAENTEDLGIVRINSAQHQAYLALLDAGGFQPLNQLPRGLLVIREGA